LVSGPEVSTPCINQPRAPSTTHPAAQHSNTQQTSRSSCHHPKSHQQSLLFSDSSPYHTTHTFTIPPPNSTQRCNLGFTGLTTTSPHVGAFTTDCGVSSAVAAASCCSLATSPPVGLLLKENLSRHSLCARQGPSWSAASAAGSAAHLGIHHHLGITDRLDGALSIPLQQHTLHHSRVCSRERPAATNGSSRSSSSSSGSKSMNCLSPGVSLFKSIVCRVPWLLPMVTGSGALGMWSTPAKQTTCNAQTAGLAELSTGR